MLMTFADVEPRSNFELTRDEVLSISEEISRNFSPVKTVQSEVRSLRSEKAEGGLHAADSVTEHQLSGFSYQDLQAIGQDISQRFSTKASNVAPELLLLPVDPYHLYAYWDIGRNKALAAAEYNAENPLTLRIYWRPDASPEMNRSHVWFDIRIEYSLNRKKLRLPIDDTYYSADLGRLNPDHSLEVLAHSNLIHVPTAPGRKNVLRPAPTQEVFEDKEQPVMASHSESIYFASSLQNTGFLEGWSIRLHSGEAVPKNCDITKLYLELMNIFNDIRADVELIPEFALASESANSFFKHASGFGL
jgi:hypothetical protein